MSWALLVFKTIYITATTTKIPLGVLMLELIYGLYDVLILWFVVCAYSLNDAWCLAFGNIYVSVTKGYNVKSCFIAFALLKYKTPKLY